MNKRLQQIQNWPEQAQAAKWSASTLAKHCGVSLRTLERHFKSQMGKSPKTWLCEQRLLLGKKLVEDGLSVKEAAGSLDYKHPHHFARDFNGYWGRYPANTAAPMWAQNL